MTTGAFKPLSAAEQVFKTLVWDPFVKGGEMWIEGSVPAFNLPVLKQVEEGTLNQLSDWMYSQFCLWADVGAFKFIDSQRQSAYEKSSEKVLLILQEKGVDSDDFKKAAADETAALAKFVSFGS